MAFGEKINLSVIASSVTSNALEFHLSQAIGEMSQSGLSCPANLAPFPFGKGRKAWKTVFLSPFGLLLLEYPCDAPHVPPWAVSTHWDGPFQENDLSNLSLTSFNYLHPGYKLHKYFRAVLSEGLRP